MGGAFEGFSGGLGGFSDIFSDIFGDFFWTSAASGRARRQGGSDLEYRLELPFKEAVFGLEKMVTIPRSEVCNSCNGEGAEPGTGKISCSKCGGSGQVRVSQGFFSILRMCLARRSLISRCLATG